MPWPAYCSHGVIEDLLDCEFLSIPHPGLLEVLLFSFLVFELEDLTDETTTDNPRLRPEAGGSFKAMEMGSALYFVPL